MIEKMNALTDNGTLDLVRLPAGKKAIGCHWVFTVKVNPDGSIARLTTHLVAKGYAQTYGIDYFDTFSLVAKMTYVWLFISLDVTYNWDLHQLDIKNVFLHDDLQEEVYMEQPPGGEREGISSSEVFRVHVRGLVNSAKLLRNLACRRVNLTTPSSTGTPVQVSFYW